MDESIVKSKLVNALKVSMDFALNNSAQDSLTGFGILTDETGIMFVPVATYSDTLNFDLTGSDWNTELPSHAIEVGSTLLNQLYDESSDEENDDNWHEQFRSRAYLILVRCLEILRHQKEYAPFIDKVFMNVWVVDSNLPNIRGRAWGKRLNSSQTYSKLVDWLDQEFNGF